MKKALKKTSNRILLATYILGAVGLIVWLIYLKNIMG